MNKENKYPRGSEWRKWDLHIHSNASDGRGTPEQIVNEALNKGISVIALTDHHSAENIDEIKNYAKDKNITIISGIEFRTEYGEQSVHLIGLFPDEYNGTILDSTNLYELILCKLKLSKVAIINKGKEEDKTLSDEKAFKKGIFLVQVDFREVSKLIREYGGLVSVHAGDKSNSIEMLKHEGKAETNTKTLATALGTVKEEMLNNYVDICDIETSYDNANFYLKNFNLPSIITSDAHKTEDVGSNFTWIKADPTFEGLKQALKEIKDRIFIETNKKPKKLIDIEQNGTRYINTISILPSSNNQDNWFNTKIELNQGLISIIGNKGSGKSALADAIGLAGNSYNKECFSFLNNDKFLKLKKEAENHIIKIEFLNKDNDKQNIFERQLKDDINKNQIEKVQYIPQSYFEKVCNTLKIEDDLKKEIEKVIFSHIDISEQLGTTEFSNLLAIKNKEISQRIETLKQQLSILIDKFAKIQIDFNSNNQALKKNKLKEIEQQRDSINKLLLDLKEPEKPISDNNYTKYSNRITTIVKYITTKTINYNENNKLITIKNTEQQIIKNAKGSIDNLKTSVENSLFNIQNEFKLNKIHINVNDLVELSLYKFDNFFIQNNSELEKIITDKKESNKYIEDRIKKAQKLKIKIEEKLNSIAKEYQIYLNKKNEYEEKIKQINGNEKEPLSIPNTFYYYKHITSLNFLDEKELEKNQLYNDIENITIKIFEHILSIKETYNLLKNNTEQYINDFKKNEEIENFNVAFNSKTKINKDDFENNFFLYITKRGDYRGDDGKNNLKSKFFDVDYDNKETIKKILKDIVDDIENNFKQDDSSFLKNNNLEELKKFYQYLFYLTYLNVDYSLEFNNKELSLLSPGERGLLLLIFFLLANKSDIPLILDQPEENLDNQTIYKILVPLIKHVKKHRQVIMVTHNPNLAVVCDSEQIISAKINYNGKPKINYTCGSIENNAINQEIVNILEGTMPAFENRRKKYNLN